MGARRRDKTKEARLNHATTVPEELARLIDRAIRVPERTCPRAANGVLEEARVAADHGRGYESL